MSHTSAARSQFDALCFALYPIAPFVDAVPVPVPVPVPGIDAVPVPVPVPVPGPSNGASCDDVAGKTRYSIMSLIALRCVPWK